MIMENSERKMYGVKKNLGVKCLSEYSSCGVEK